VESEVESLDPHARRDQAAGVETIALMIIGRVSTCPYMSGDEASITEHHQRSNASQAVICRRFTMPEEGLEPPTRGL